MVSLSCRYSRYSLHRLYIGCEDSDSDDNIYIVISFIITDVRYYKQEDNIRMMAARVIHNKVCQDI